MKTVDFFWYLYYRFSFYTCKREAYNAKWIATLGVAMSFSCMIDASIDLYLHLFNYQFFVKYWYSNAIIAIFILMGIISTAYFYGIKKVSMDKEEEQYITFSPRKRGYIWAVFVFAAIGPLLLDLALILFARPVNMLDYLTQT